MNEWYQRNHVRTEFAFFGVLLLFFILCSSCKLSRQNRSCYPGFSETISGFVALLFLLDSIVFKKFTTPSCGRIIPAHSTGIRLGHVTCFGPCVSEQKHKVIVWFFHLSFFLCHKTSNVPDGSLCGGWGLE